MSNAHRAGLLADIRVEPEADEDMDSIEDSEEVMKDLLFLIHGFSPAPDGSSDPDITTIHQTDG